jgi:hypothetical protein
MFCPKCSQPQASDETRFCPRCGFLLAGLKELVAGGGLVAASASDAPARGPSPRRRGIRQGARLLFLSVVLFPLLYGFCFVIDSPLPLAISGSLFLAGLALMLYARLFSESLLPAWGCKEDAQLGESANDYALPFTARAPAAALGPQPANTSEMIRPASVVDHTTSLLERS